MFAIVLLLFGSGLLLFYLGLRSFRKSKVVAQIPESPIRGIAWGMVRVFGRVEGDEPLTSPITGSPCFYYRVSARKLVGEGTHQRWEDFKEATANRKFYINDGTARVLVDPENAEFDLTTTLKAEVGHKSEHSCSVDPALSFPVPSKEQLHAILMSDWDRKKGPTAPVEELPVREEEKPEKEKWWVPKKISLEIEGLGGIELGAKPEKYSLEETCLLVGREYSIVGTCDQEPNSEIAPAAKVIRMGTEEKTFMISSRRGELLVKNLRRQAVIMLILAIVLIGASPVMWHYRGHFVAEGGEEPR
jgi:E3 Ubiquitin ligase